MFELKERSSLVMAYDAAAGHPQEDALASCPERPILYTPSNDMTMTSHQASAPSTEPISWLDLENASAPDGLDAELSDDDLEQVAGGLTRTWKAPPGYLERRALVDLDPLRHRR